jgi:hypothetical protein
MTLTGHMARVVTSIRDLIGDHGRPEPSAKPSDAPVQPVVAAAPGDPDGNTRLEPVQMTVEKGNGPVELPVDKLTETEMALTRAKDTFEIARKQGKDVRIAQSLLEMAWTCYATDEYDEAIRLTHEVHRSLSMAA